MKKDKTTLSPSLRRRILERDKFTCTDCGKQVPRVYLHIDRILSPETAEALGDVPEEDKYTCYCDTCSRKFNHKLQPHGIVTAADRRAQLDMLIAWRRELQTLDDAAHQILIEYIRPHVRPVGLRKEQKSKLRMLLLEYDIIEILNALDIAIGRYVKYEGDDAIEASVKEMVAKLGGILHNMKLTPLQQELNHIRCICRKNFDIDYDEREAKALLHEYKEYLQSQGLEDDQILLELAKHPKSLSGTCGTFEQWRKAMKELLPKREESGLVPSACNEEEEPLDSQEYRYSFSDYELFCTLDVELGSAKAILRTLLYLYRQTGCYTRERWHEVIKYLDRVMSDFLDQQYMTLRESFDVPSSSPIRTAIEPYFNSWEFGDLLCDNRPLPEGGALEPDIRRVVLSHVLPDLAYKLFSFFDTYSEHFDYDATRKTVDYFIQNYKRVLNSCLEEADSLQ